MGKIQIENMEFYAYHGCYKEEQVVGNHFLVDLTLETDCKKPMKSDNLEDALNYLKVYEFVKAEMQIKSHLLEHVAGRILETLYAEFDQIEHATVKVRKMNPPLGGKMESVSVTLDR
ncbi:MAG TPA: dihydroneopterin aldolase [Salinivirga sp.]|uniref:dihydroneopterin aldolase n=1 Tax=Salinivirga sp. TaxID=1970192 RepID=UPI002B47A26A|nr:dihydroneopterin aldolase [Salinivirga sp.]HKK58853.1 dihydroneopterin aldolase [Salinivirga sp.]